MHADRLCRFANLRISAMVKLDIGFEAARIAADDGQHQRQIVMHSAHHRFRTADDADPGPQRSLFDRWIDALVVERRPDGALPADRLVAQEMSENIELLLEQPFVVGELVTEQWKRLDEGAAADGDLGAAVRS